MCFGTTSKYFNGFLRVSIQTIFYYTTGVIKLKYIIKLKYYGVVLKLPYIVLIPVIDEVFDVLKKKAKINGEF